MQAPYKKKNRLTRTRVDKLPEDHPDRILMQGEEDKKKRKEKKKQVTQ